MMSDSVMKLILYCGKKLFCNRTVHIIVSTALGVNVRDFLIKTALAGANITNTLQLFLKIVLTKEVFWFSQSCIVHHIAFNNKFF